MLLEKGKAYFEIVFCLPEEGVPEIESYIFIGKNIFKGDNDSDEYYFQTPCSYYKDGNFAEEKDKMDAAKRAKAEIVLMHEDAIDGLYTIDTLIAELKTLSANHPFLFGKFEENQSADS
jgi:hypothetical protein